MIIFACFHAFHVLYVSFFIFGTMLSGLLTFFLWYATLACCVCIPFWCVQFNLGVRSTGGCSASFLKAQRVSRLCRKLSVTRCRYTAPHPQSSFQVLALQWSQLFHRVYNQCYFWTIS